MEQRNTRERRVVVTGVGMLTAVGNDVATTWRSLLDGKSGVGPITQFDANADFDVRFAAEVKGFDPESVLERKEARRMDRFADVADLLGLLVRDLDAELLLEGHDQLHGVQRVGAQIFDERGFRSHLLRLHTQLVDDDVLDLGLDVRHRSAPCRSSLNVHTGEEPPNVLPR
jgi:hypothetical protein